MNTKSISGLGEFGLIDFIKKNNSKPLKNHNVSLDIGDDCFVYKGHKKAKYVVTTDILIENVPKFLKLYFPFNGEVLKLIDICTKKYSEKYNVDSFVLNAKDYNVPQSRPRGFIRLWKKGLSWEKPKPSREITLRECIGDLPSLEPGKDSGIKWHFAKPHNEREILAMRHTPEGISALKNPVYYPKKPNGEPIKGFHNTYKRMKWDEPSPARAMNNGNLGGHNNGHPGRPLPDGTYSDARVMTLRELFIVSSIVAFFFQHLF